MYTHVENLVLLLKSILHPIRFNILCLLHSHIFLIINRRASVATCEENINQHSTIFRNQGVIDFRKDVGLIYNRIVEARIIEFMKRLQQLFCDAETSTPSV